jgi:hypothetical protein
MGTNLLTILKNYDISLNEHDAPDASDALTGGRGVLFTSFLVSCDTVFISV